MSADEPRPLFHAALTSGEQLIVRNQIVILRLLCDMTSDAHSAQMAQERIIESQRSLGGEAI